MYVCVHVHVHVFALVCVCSFVCLFVCVCVCVYCACHNLQRVEDGKEPGKDCGIAVESEQTKQPR